jgi:DNA invertase Pin-like site-specific DNA recombinase
LKGVARKDFDLIACFSVCRIGRSLPDLISFLGDIQAKGVDLYLHTQGLDTSTPSGALCYQMLSVFSSYERAILRERILSGLRRTTKKSGRKPMPDDRVQAIRKSLIDGSGIRATARLHRASTTTVTAIKRSLETVEEAVLETVAA